MKRLCLLGMIMVGLQGQTAEVVALSPKDTYTLKSLYEEKELLEDKIKIEHEFIMNKYVPKSSHAGLTIGGSYEYPAWSDYETTKDFKYIVPKSKDVPCHSTWPYGGATGGAIGAATFAVGPVTQ